MFSESKIQEVWSEDGVVLERWVGFSMRISQGYWIHLVKSVWGFATLQLMNYFLSFYELQIQPYSTYYPCSPPPPSLCLQTWSWRDSWTLEPLLCRERERGEREIYENSEVKEWRIFKGILSRVHNNVRGENDMFYFFVNFGFSRAPRFVYSCIIIKKLTCDVRISYCVIIF